MSKVMHNCVSAGVQLPVKPGSTCEHCLYEDNAVCMCLLCHVETKAHAKEFFVVPNKIESTIPGAYFRWPNYPVSSFE